MRAMESALVPRRERGVIRHPAAAYGTSADGAPLHVYGDDTGRAGLLVIAAIHGDEPETTVAVSEALRCIPGGDLRAAVILCANPDGRQVSFAMTIEETLAEKLAGRDQKLVQGLEFLTAPAPVVTEQK